MCDELRVDPEALRHAADEIAGHGETLHTILSSSHDAAQDARPGWAGSSAGALSGLLDSWATTGAAQIRRIGEQSRAMLHAAATFLGVDQRNAAALTGLPMV